ncbi:hypothetical protein GCM10010172_06590 [Paractinoplanes ferrugineus]|uniref:Uncharacterized protein n=1 Tax=Paractinoplanes ferrugineus TaxID=113564 RepID=A0A919J8Y3_9ACTN|nr:hypothetical protein [Actinoplanes ferrugineus]GIE16313.1 hypothetical protein Afe05nite_81530 [Actinoplanes ferrugineus]
MSDMESQRTLILNTVAATLRQLAGWGLAFDNGPASGELIQIAQQVEGLTAAQDMCCPMCEEVDCDEDCPLAPVRAAR